MARHWRGGVDPNSGLGTLLDRVADMPERKAIEADINAVMADRPPLYMVNSDKGITNLHVPSDVIVDASMPALIRAGGKGWGPDGKAADTNCVIPDSSYAAVYDEAIAISRRPARWTRHGGHRAEHRPDGAEGRGIRLAPHDLRDPADGTVRLIWPMATCCTSTRSRRATSGARPPPARPRSRIGCKLAIDRQKAEGCQAIFWLDATRAHDAS
jgi:isocitrate dehydrogenase